MRDEFYEKPVSFEMLEHIRGELVREAALQGFDTEKYDLGIADFIFELRNRMGSTGTVFYQP